MSEFYENNEQKALTRDTQGLAVQARAQAEVQAKIIMAKKFPRSEDQAFDRMLTSLTRVSFAEESYYSFPRGGASVEGPSVNLAREFARCWGNIVYSLNIVHMDDENVTIEGIAWDMETNTYISNQASFKKKIYRKNKGWIIPDERDLRELINRHGAMCVRNAILQLLPKDMINRCMDRAKATIKGGVKGNVKSAMSDSIRFFSEYSVAISDLENYLSVKKDKWNDETMVTLRGLARSLKDGQVTASEIRETKTASASNGEAVDITDIINGTENIEQKEEPEDQKRPPKKITDPQKKKVFALAGELGVSKEQIDEIIKNYFNVDSIKDIKALEVDRLIEIINSCIPEKKNSFVDMLMDLYKKPVNTQKIDEILTEKKIEFETLTESQADDVIEELTKTGVK